MRSGGHILEARLDALPGVAIRLVRSARARRYSLRVSALDGRVTLTLPARGSTAEALRFAASRADWLAGVLRRRPPRVAVAPGTMLPVFGRPVALVAASGLRAARLEGATLLVPDAPGRAGPGAAAFLREAARAALADACGRHARALGRRPGRITLRDARSRWGSCSARGDLMFSWRLAMAPPEVLDYVAAHEVAHLERMDHSPAFWQVVARLCPGHRAPRAWLRQEGAGLHRFDFGG
jgi:predicted metal-dependent hydrolase